MKTIKNWTQFNDNKEESNPIEKHESETNWSPSKRKIDELRKDDPFHQPIESSIEGKNLVKELENHISVQKKLVDKIVPFLEQNIGDGFNPHSLGLFLSHVVEDIDDVYRPITWIGLNEKGKIETRTEDGMFSSITFLSMRDLEKIVKYVVLITKK